MALMKFMEIREAMEAAGYKLDDEQYHEAVVYAYRKAIASGKDESYVPLLLPDVIREWVVRHAINTISKALVDEEQIRKHGRLMYGTGNTGMLAGRYTEGAGGRADEA